MFSIQKNAVSVIENVIYAHDAEKKWIQNHPVVLYEAYIIRHILETLNQHLDSENSRLFSEKSLYEDSNVLNNDTNISLLCDDDIIYMAKNMFSDRISKELFSRKQRMHPVWKSEAEYQAYLGTLSGGDQKDVFIDCLKSFNESKIDGYIKPTIINQSLLKTLEAECEKSKEAVDAAKGTPSHRSLSNSLKGTVQKIKLCKFLLERGEKICPDCDFLILQADMFNSNFSKDHLKKELICFGMGEDGYDNTKTIEQVCTILTSQSVKETCFYLFYRRGAEPSQQIEDVDKFCEEFFNAVTK